MDPPGGGNDVAQVRQGGAAVGRVSKCRQPRRCGHEDGRKRKKMQPSDSSYVYSARVSSPRESFEGTKGRP